MGTQSEETPQKVYSVDVPFVSTINARSAAQVYCLLLNLLLDVYTEQKFIYYTTNRTIASVFRDFIVMNMTD